MRREEAEKLIDDKVNGIRLLIKGEPGTGKTSLLQERYLFLRTEMEVPDAEILVFCADINRADSWNSVLAGKTSAAPVCYTITSFIKEELTLFYPLISGFSKIIKKELKPEFLSYEAGILLMSKVIQAKRDRDGYFNGLVSSNQQIAEIVARNLKTAAYEGIPAEEIGERLYEALDRQDAQKERIFKDLDEIGLSYREKLYELGILDTGAAAELYLKYLLPDAKYRQSLAKRFRHLIVDDMQEAPYIMLELLSLMITACDSACISYDSPYGSMDAAENINGHKVVRHCAVIELEADTRNSLADAIYSAILDNGEVKVESPLTIERYPAAELRSEMLEQVARKVCSLIQDEGYRPADIVILSTYADIVAELAIGSILEDNGIKLVNSNSRRNAADSAVCAGILAFAKLCHPGLRMFPDKQEVKHMLQLLFGLDPVTCAKIARRVCSSFPFPELPETEAILGEDVSDDIKEKYTRVKKWINDYKTSDKPVSIGVFLQLALVEVFLDAGISSVKIYEAKQMADIAEKFYRSTSGFGRNTARDFIEMAESILKAEEIAAADVAEEGAMLTTPEYYAVNPVYSKVLIISGLSSRHWLKGIARELSNPRVLSASWQRGVKYTAEMEEAESRQQLAAMLFAAFRKSSRILSFESILNENGFENDGILPDILEKIQLRFMSQR